MMDLSGSWVTAGIVGIGIYLLVRWTIQKLRYKYPPGPPALPLLGNMFQINNQYLHEQVFALSQKYGPVVTIYMGTMPVIFVNTIDIAMEVLVKRSTDFANRVKMPSTDIFTYNGKDIAFTNYGPTWKLHRKIASKALRYYMQAEALEQRIHNAVEVTFKELDKIMEPFEPSEYMNFIVVNILSGMCFGGNYDFADKEVNYMLEKEEALLHLFNGTLEDLIPWVRYVYKSAGFKRLEEFTEEVIGNFIGRKYQEAFDTFDKNNIRHFVDDLIMAKLEDDNAGSTANESLTKEHLIQTISDIFFAGVDTSRFTLKFALLHMVTHPDIQEKVQREIDQVVGHDRLPGIADRTDLGYTEAVLHESMRLATVAPTGVYHATSHDTVLAGYKIPKGTAVAINHWALHHDPSVWTDVDSFIPERYLDENGKLGPKPHNWLPFSAGKRVCLGEFVAKPELHLLFAALMQRYKWRSEPGAIIDMQPDGNSFALHPKPFKVVIEKRI